MSCNNANSDKQKYKHKHIKMTEAELAIEEKLRKKREEQEQIWQEYLEQREEQRRKEEDDLKKLKERQQRRKAQRAEQERLMQEMRRMQEETRQRELEERRRKEAEAKRKRLEDAEKKRLVMQEAIRRRDEEAKRNWNIAPRRNADPSQSGPMILGMRDVMKTKEQLAEDKRIAMQYRIKPLNIEEGLRTAQLKKLVSDLWGNIVQLESDKYDLEEEQKRQEYHLKELMERQKQINKNKALKLGLDTDDLNSNVPPKVRLASKYERKVDRRSFNEKTSLFDGGYVETSEQIKERQWADKINQFKEGHTDKTVPKWDPSAPRKDIYEPGKVIYEDSDEDDTDLVDKLRTYVEVGKQERRDSQARQQQIQQQEDRELQRRRSSQMSQMSQQSSQVNKTQAARQQPTGVKHQVKVQQHDGGEEYSDEEYEEEEYTDEEVEE